MGTRRLYHEIQSVLNDHCIKYGRDKLHDLIKGHGMLVRNRPTARTTNSNHMYRKYPNIIKDMELTRANQLWVSDITYIRTEIGFVYLSLITDAYS